MFTTVSTWLKGLSAGGKVAVVVVGFGALSAVAAPQSPANVSNPQIQGDSTTTQSQPEITKVRVTQTEPIPFKKTEIQTDTLEQGVKRVTTDGSIGEKAITYEVTKTDGIETARVKVSELVTRESIDEVTSIGTYVKPAPPPAPSSSCDPNYSGACVPIASDVDCGNGRGNGPAYVYGTVTVIGVDIYGLDRDGDGFGCE